MSAPLAYLIVRHDVCRGLEDGAPAAQAQAPAVAPTCGVCHGAGYLTTKRGKRRRRPWPRCLACDGAGAQTPAGREVL